MNTIRGWMVNLLDLVGISSGEHTWLDTLVIIIVVIAIAFLADYVCRQIVLRIFRRIAERTKTIWDDIILDRKIIHRAVNFIPAILIYCLIPLAFQEGQNSDLLNFN